MFPSNGGYPMLRKQTRSIITLILTAILIVPFFTMPVSAAYENTYTNTGNMRDDIIGVALTQVGYQEGSDNYTKYGVWYGQPNSPWCGMFVSWCAKEAGIPTSVLKKTGIANPSNFGLSYQSGSDYTPQKGDLFFKKSFSHVGLVYYTEGDYFYTIEGNTSTTSSEGDSVLIRKRKISDYYFSSPDYSGTGSASGCDHNYTTKVESDHPHKEYKLCTKCGKKSYTGETVVNETCKTCIQEACSHTFGNWAKVSNSQHSRICTKCDYTQTKSHNWTDGNVVKEATCLENGSQQILCADCGAESTKTIAATGEHIYSSFTYLDESFHQQVCSGCDEQKTSRHTLSESWEYDSIYHWTSCTECGGRICQQEHNFANGCLEPCADCGYVLAEGHKGNGERYCDESHHWEICVRCGQEINVTGHIYTSECDEICNICGYQRTGTAPHQDVYHADATGHWRRCTSCTRVTEIVPHCPDQNAAEWEDMLCTHCGYELRSADQHVHAYADVQSDALTHWGTCQCGAIMEPEGHIWDFQTGQCSVCGASAETPDSEGFLSFLIALWNFLFGK